MAKIALDQVQSSSAANGEVLVYRSDLGKWVGQSNLAISQIQANGSPGAAGQVLTSNGSSLYWSTISVGTGGFTNGQSISVNTLLANNLLVNGSITSNTVVVGPVVRGGRFEVGTGSVGTAGQVLTSNGFGNSYWATPPAGTLDDVLASGNTTSKSLQVGHITSANLTAQGDVQFFGNSTVYFGWESKLWAGGSIGSNGQVLTSNGSGIKWTTPITVNTAASYTWTGYQTFGHTVEFNSNSALIANGGFGSAGQALLTNGSGKVYWGTVAGGGFTNGQSISVSNLVFTYGILGGVNGSEYTQLSNTQLAIYSNTNGTNVLLNYSTISTRKNDYTLETSQNTSSFTAVDRTVDFINPEVAIITGKKVTVGNTTVNSTMTKSSISTPAFFTGNAFVEGSRLIVSANATFSGNFLADKVKFSGYVQDVLGNSGTAGQVLTSNGINGVYWTTPAVANGSVGGFTNGQSISVTDITVTNTATLSRVSANGSTGTAGQILYSSGTGTYWDAPPVANGSVGTLDQVLAAGNTTTKALTVGPLTVNGSANVTGRVVVGNPLGYPYVVINGNTDSSSVENGTVTAWTFRALQAIIPTRIIDKNNSSGTDGQVLTSNGSFLYWTTPAIANGTVGTLDQVLAAGNTTTKQMTTGNIVPSSTYAYNLGTNSQRWGNFYSLNGDILYATLGQIAANGSTGTAGQVLASNGSGIYWTTPAGVANGSVGTLDQVLAAGNITTKALTVGPLTVNSSINVVGNTVIGGALFANGSVGVSGQVLTTSGTGLYWSTPATGSGSNGVSYSLTQYVAIDKFTGTGMTTVFTLTYSATKNTVQVYVDGLLLNPDIDYTVIGTTLTFASAPYVNESIIVYHSGSTTNVTTLINDAYSNAYADAVLYTNSKASESYSNAVSYTDTKAATAYSNAVSTAAADATTKAGTAYANAISQAASDATSKAATAYTNATSYADTKAAAAYSNAIATAASDATTKAATAYSNAVAYAASNTYVNSTFAYKASPVLTGPISANGTAGAAGQVLTSAGSGANAYWAAASGGFTNGQSITVASLNVNGLLTSNTNTRATVANTYGFIDLSLGNYFAYVSASPTPVISFGNPPAAGIVTTITVKLPYVSSVTFPASVVWPYGLIPTFNAARTTFINFTTDNGGVTYYGAVVAEY